jgi:hypothetical protein
VYSIYISHESHHSSFTLLGNVAEEKPITDQTLFVTHITELMEKVNYTVKKPLRNRLYVCMCNIYIYICKVLEVAEKLYIYEASSI